MDGESKKLIPFSLKDHLKNPDRKIVTLDGRSVRIICIDRRVDDYSIVALVQDNDGEKVYSYTKNGLSLHGIEDPNNIFFVIEKKTGWINVYRSECIGIANNVSRRVYNTREEALNGAKRDRIDTIKIEWEEYELKHEKE